MAEKQNREAGIPAARIFRIYGLKVPVTDMTTFYRCK